MTRLSFPQRVYNVLKLCEEQGRQDIISWENDGTAFTVNDKEEFERDLLPRYFNTEKYSSFTRTLNSYGFAGVRTGRQPGIYSHPKFNRNDPRSPSLIKRTPAKKSSKTKPLVNQHQTVSSNPTSNNSGTTAFDGEQIFQLPSLLSGVRREDDSGNETVFGQLCNTVTSQVANQARYLLIRLPPGSQVAGIFDTSKESEATNSFMNSRKTSPTYASSESNSMTTSSSNMMSSSSLGQEDERKPIAPSRSVILGSGRAAQKMESAHREMMSPIIREHQEYGIQLNPDDFDPIPLYQEDNDNMEPIAWSPSESSSVVQQEDSILPNEHLHPLPTTSLEPRSIEEMRDNPDDLNVWYRFLPIIPTPRLQAQLEFSSPLSMPVACYFLDISTFGMVWSFIFTVGHTLQSLLTVYGPDTESFTLSPEIGIVPHHFMDMMWMHSQFTILVLLPDVFGPSSMTLLNYFVMTQALNLSIGVKTNYHHIEVKRGVWGPGRWWLADIVRWIFLGYLGSFFAITIGEYYGIENLKVIGVFVLNLTVLWVWESYRLLLSTRGRVECEINVKKLD